MISAWNFLKIPALVFSLSLIGPGPSSAQDSLFAAGRFTRIYADRMDQLYAVTPLQEVLLYGRKGGLLFRYSNNRLGAIGWIDVSNPLRILVYYPGFMKAVLLDRTLTELAVIDLADLGKPLASAVALSSDNQLWVWDAATYSLSKMDIQGRVLQEGPSFALMPGIPPTVNFLLEYEQQVYANAPGQGVLVFDAFGQYLQTLPLTEWEGFGVQNGVLFSHRNNQVELYDIRTGLTHSISAPDQTESQHAASGRERIYWLLPQGVWSDELRITSWD